MLFRVGLVVRVCAAQERDPVEHAFLEPFQREINHGRDVERDQLRNDQAADDDEPERPARRAIQRRSQAQSGSAPIKAASVVMIIGRKRSDARFVNGRAPVVAFVQPMEREVDDHDAVLLHDAHEEEEANHGIKRERGIKKPERHQAADDRREKRREHGNRMDVALVENSENHVHDEERRDDEEGQRR